ncbi:MAG: hemerythrin domain-containing protein [Chitinophagaceae bacterium]
MNRYNVFNTIHKGLRALMYDTAAMIQRTDFSVKGAAETVSRVNWVMDIFDEHARHEDQFLLPLAFKNNETLAQEFEKEHEVDHRLSDELRSALKGWEKADTDTARITAGQAIFFAFNEFIAFNLYHMNKEENVLLLNLWTHYTDQDLLAAENAIVQSIDPATLMEESKWMMRSISNPEIIGWLSGIRHAAPPPVFEIYLSLAKQEVPADRFAEVAAALGIPTAA